MDESSDFEQYKKKGVLDYILELKEKDIVHHTGLSTHTPSVANEILDLGIIDIMMLSIDPAYDYQYGEFAIGSNDERELQEVLAYFESSEERLFNY